MLQADTRSYAPLSGLPLVWMSGHPRDVEFPRDKPGQEHPFLMKPVSPGALLEIVSRALQKSSEA